MADTRITDAEIAGYMGWRGPGAYTEASLRKIRQIVDHVLRAERATPPSPSTVSEVDEPSLSESIDTPEFYDLAASWKGSGSDATLWSDMIDRINEYARREVAAALASRPAEVDDEGLPPLPEKRGTIYWGNYWTDCAKEDPLGRPLADVFTEEQYRQGQRDAVAADRARRGDGWLPFDTAPRDGSSFLATNGVIVTACRYIDDPGHVREVRDMQGRYIDQVEYDGFDGFMDEEGGLPDLTHWMPYPAAPSHTTNKENG